MAGVVINNKRGDDFLGVLGGIAQQGLGGLLNGMFERDAAANAYRLQTRLADEDVARQRGVRDEQWQFDTGTRAPWVQENIRYDRMDPSVDAQSIAIMSMLDDDAGKNLATTYGDMMPNMTSQNVDYGNQIGNQIFNQRTGAMEQSMTEKGLDPTQKYQSDASMSNARTAAGASNYATSVRQALGQLEADLTREGRNLEQSNLMNGWKPAGVDNNGVALEHNPYQGYRTSIDEAGVAVTPAPQGSGDVKYGSPVQDASGQFYIPANGQMIPQGVQGMPKDNSSAIANALKALDPFGDSQDPGVQSLRQQLTSGFQQPPQRRQQPPGTVRLVDATTFRQLSSEDMPELWQLYQSGQVQLSPAVRANLEQAFRGGGAY